MKIMNRWFIVSLMLVISLVAGVWVSYDFNYKQILEREQRELSSALEAERLLFQAKLDKYASDITILQSIPPVQAIIQAKSDSQNSEVLTIWKSRLKSIFKSYLTANEMAFQLRYIGFNENGKEIVNVKKEAGVAQVVPERLLQEKSGRDYFSEIRLNQLSGVYISDISLNRDFDSISIPYNPTVRIAAKVMASNGVPFGFIIINISANAIFKELISKVPKDASLYITNDKGEVLFYPDESLNFAFEHVDVPVWDELYSESQEMFVLNDGARIAPVNPSRSIIAKVNFPLTSGLNSLNIILKKDIDDIHLRAMSATFFSVGWVFVIIVGLIFVIFSIRKSLKVQAALSIEKTQKSLIVESSQDAILGVSIDGTITEWNNSATKMFGLSRHEVIGELTRDVFFTDSVQTEDEYIVSQFVKGYKVKPFETKRQTKRSQVFDVSISASPICDEHGELIGFSKIIRDITEQKRVSNELELLNASLEKEVQQRTVELNKSHSLQAAIMDKAATAIIATNMQGYITLFNPAAEKLLGYSAEELIGKQTPGVFHLESEVIQRAVELSEEFGQKFEPGFDVFVAETLAGLRNDREWTYVSKVGHKIPVYLSISALYDENDEVSGFLGMATNISELTSSRKKLEVLKDQLAKASEIADIGIWSWDPSNNDVSWNQKMYDVYEIENNNMRVPFSDWVEMVSESDRERAIEHFRRFTTDGGESSIVFDIVTAKGNRKTIHASATIERDQFDDSVRLIGINKDITKQTQYENALKEAKDASEQASRTKSEFVANMSHEIRTPMNAIIGLLTLLRKTSLTEKQIDYVTKSDSAARSLLRILNDILDFSKVEAGKLDIDPHRFNLHDLAGNVASLLNTSLEKKELELRIDVDPALPKFVTLDSYRLQQILINLAGNAIKFTTKGHVAIKFSLDKTSDHVLHIEVVDTGIGIAKDKHTSVFEAFSQAETSTVRAFGGTGLGLVISKTLVELMGGEISLESVEGCGSTFKFYVPFTDGCDESSCSAQSQLDSGHVVTYEKRLQDVTILLVEDNPINRLVARESLESEGATILTAENGEQAVKAVKKSGAVIDVVLMDVQMPIMDGYTATKEIRALKSFSGIPIIAMTANALMSDKKAAAQAGMDDHISKPFDIAQLVRIISAFTVSNISSKYVLYADSDNKAERELSDFNHRAALSRLGDNRDILCAAAESFIADSETAMGSIPTVVTDDNVSDVMRAIHSLKGASLTVGAERTAGKLAELEIDLKLHKYEHYSVKVKETSELLVDACCAIQAFLFGQAKSVEQAHVVPKKESVTRLEIIELCDMLAQSNMKVLDICSELKRKDQGPYHSVLSEIDADVQNLDFRNAQARLERFLKSEC